MNSYKKICSFLPAATNILVSLELEHLIEGVTFECSIDKPRVILSKIYDKQLSASEISKIVSEHKEQNIAVNTIDYELVKKINPDIIFTQAICNVCQIGEADVCNAKKELSLSAEIYSLNPTSLEEVFDNILTVARVVEHPQKGEDFLKNIQIRIQHIEQTISTYNLNPKRISFFEWMNPLFNAGHWIPDQISIAGGHDPLANPREHSFVIDNDAIVKVNPEVIIFSACGMSMKQSIKEVTQVLQQDFWKDLAAYKNNNIWVVEGNLFTQPGSDLVDGIELLAGIFHPNHFTIPAKLNNEYLQLDLFDKKD
ncbi:MAG: hypothetical protein COB15_14295 [Flavobacteriales bacterium]|nr:MAG: hypothetical protein COB15_14295 [Flavobacteriales bacterium]